MATISYTCNVCDRSIDLLENPTGLTTFFKCIITAGCRGKLVTVKRNPDNFRESFPAEVSGLIDYSPRNILFNYEQQSPNNTWSIQHNLGVSPAVTVYVKAVDGTLSELNPNDYQINFINSNKIIITFNAYYSGEAQLVARTSAKSIPSSVPQSVSLSQATSNGYFVFAIPKYLTQFTYPPQLLPTPPLPYDLANNTNIRIEITITKPNQEPEICTEFLSSSLINTPWNGWNEILVRRRKNCYLFSKSILNLRTLGGETIKFSDIPNGTQLTITRIDYGMGTLQPIDNEGLFILLANPPYTPNDKIKDKVIDVGDMVTNTYNSFSYLTSDFFTNPLNVNKIYPEIIQVKPVFPIPPSVTPYPTSTPTPSAIPSMPSNLYVGGDFYLTPNAKYSPNIGVLDSTGVPVSSNLSIFSYNSSNPYTYFQALDGKMYIGGNFYPDQINFWGLLRLNSDGTLDNSYTNYASGAVGKIIQVTNGKLYIAGGTISDGTHNYSGLARLNSDGTLDTTFVGLTFDAGGIYDMIETSDSKIYIVGSFSTVNSSPYKSVARLNSDGTLDTTFSNLAFSNGYCKSTLQTDDGKIYIGGYFALVSGYTYSCLVRLNSDGTLDTTFVNIDANDIVNDMIQSLDGKIYIAGAFASPTNRIARLNSDGSLDSSFTGVPFNPVSSIFQTSDNKIYVGGQLLSTYTGLARLNSDGTVDSTFEDVHTYVDDSNDGNITDIGQAANGNIYIVGNIAYLNYSVSGVAFNKFDSNDNLDSNYSIIPDSNDYPRPTVYCSTKFNDKIFIGGNYTDNSGYTWLSRLNTDGSIDDTFGMHTFTGSGESGGAIFALLNISNTVLYVGGAFSDVDGISNSSGLMKLDSSGEIITYKSPFNYISLRSLLHSSDDKIYVGGYFTDTYDSSSNFYEYDNLCRLNVDGTLDTTFTNITVDGQNLTDVVYALLQTVDGKIYVGGNFYNDICSYLLRLNSDGTLDTTFTPNVNLGIDSSVFALLQTNDGKIYVGGSFASVFEGTYKNLFRLNSDGTLDTSFNPIDFEGDNLVVNSLHVNSLGYIYVGGSFSTVDGHTYTSLCKLNPDGTLNTSFANTSYPTISQPSVYTIVET